MFAEAVKPSSPSSLSPSSPTTAPSPLSHIVLITILFLCAVQIPSHLAQQPPTYLSYTNQTRLFEEKLGATSGYNTAVRPILNQSRPITVNVTFEIVAIVEIDVIKQHFIVNGFLGLSWTDELLAWDLEDYGYTFMIHPEPKQIWRPRVILSNTLEDRDLFEDDYCPVVVLFDGTASWFPGSLFPASCKLDMYKYPFDVQTCYIEMLANGWISSEMVFSTTALQVGQTFFVKSGEWNIEDSSITASAYSDGLPYFRINFRLRRLPGFFIINIVTPIVLMSFLNILVFLIPVESGEKISYGITVLLAVTVFMSIVSSQLPRSSDTLPLVTVYLLVLTVISVCTVIVSIASVYCHYREEKQIRLQQAKTNFRGAFNKFRILSRATSAFRQVSPAPTNASDKPEMNYDADRSEDKTDSVLNVVTSLSGKNNKCNNSNIDKIFSSGQRERERHETGDSESDVVVNRWRTIGRHLDRVSFVVFTVVWVSVTIGFLVEIAR